VGMAASDRQDALHGVLINRNVRCSTAFADERRECGSGYNTQWQRTRGPIQGLVLIGEDPAHEMLTAPQEDVRDVSLRLENRAHQCRQVWVDFDDLLELVQDKHDAALALVSHRLREFEQPLEEVLGRAPML